MWQLLWLHLHQSPLAIEQLTVNFDTTSKIRSLHTPDLLAIDRLQLSVNTDDDSKYVSIDPRIFGFEIVPVSIKLGSSDLLISQSHPDLLPLAVNHL